MRWTGSSPIKDIYGQELDGGLIVWIFEELFSLEWYKKVVSSLIEEVGMFIKLAERSCYFLLMPTVTSSVLPRERLRLREQYFDGECAFIDWISGVRCTLVADRECSVRCRFGVARTAVTQPRVSIGGYLV